MLRLTLEQDGFAVADGVLRIALLADIISPDVMSELVRLLDHCGLTTAGLPRNFHPVAIRTSVVLIAMGWALCGSRCKHMAEDCLSLPKKSRLGSRPPGARRQACERRQELAGFSASAEADRECYTLRGGFISSQGSTLNASASRPSTLTLAETRARSIEPT